VLIAICFAPQAKAFLGAVSSRRRYQHHAETVRDACRGFREGELKLTLNMEKTHITHVNDGFVFLGYGFRGSPE
jgi:RNA-directed DNA polymerase